MNAIMILLCSWRYLLKPVEVVLLLITADQRYRLTINSWLWDCGVFGESSGALVMRCSYRRAWPKSGRWVLFLLK